MLQAVARSHGVREIEKRSRKRNRKKKQPHHVFVARVGSCVPAGCHPRCSSSLAFIVPCLLSPAFMVVFVVPCVHGSVHCPCHLSSSLPFIVPAVHPPCYLFSPPFILPAVHCHGCSHSSSSSVFVVPFVAIIIVSTSNSPYEQRLVGRLVVVCDMAAAEIVVGGRVVVAGHCCVRTEPVAAL